MLVAFSSIVLSHELWDSFATQFHFPKLDYFLYFPHIVHLTDTLRLDVTDLFFKFQLGIVYDLFNTLLNQNLKI